MIDNINIIKLILCRSVQWNDFLIDSGQIFATVYFFKVTELHSWHFFLLNWLIKLINIWIYYCVIYYRRLLTYNHTKHLLTEFEVNTCYLLDMMKIHYFYWRHVDLKHSQQILCYNIKKITWKAITLTESGDSSKYMCVMLIPSFIFLTFLSWLCTTSNFAPPHATTLHRTVIWHPDRSHYSVNGAPSFCVCFYVEH